MWRGPLAYGQATAVNTRELTRTTLGVSAGILVTNILILLDPIDPAHLPAEPTITAVSLGELSVGPLATTDPRESAARQIRLQEVESSFDPIPFDAASARAFGGVAASLRRSGRQPTARAFDALIAATAISRETELYTCHPGDFAGIDDLRLVAVPAPGS